LLECLVYIVLLGTITGIATVALGRLWQTTGRMAKTGDQISAALRAGERWREDIRSARGAVERIEGGAGCRISNGSGNIEWRWRDGVMWRKAADGEVVWLGPVSASSMAGESRDEVQAWRWEVLLAPESSKSRIAVWHSFVAVPGGALAKR